MKEKSVSIIIPVYKVPEKYLRRCIESAINQTYKNIEIIIIDDESPDNCGIICDEYANEDNRIKVVHQKNKGLSGARNTGVKEANGDWIMFLDGDDYIDNDTCEMLVSVIKYSNLDIICFPYVRENNKSSQKCEFNGIEEKLYVGNECKFLQEKILDFKAHFSSAYGKLIKRELLIKNNIFHNEILRQGAEGIEFNIRLFEKTQNVLIVKKYLYHYIYNKDSISNKHSEKNHYFVLSCFDIIKKYVMQSSNKDKLLQLLYNRMLYVIVTTAISGYFSANNNEKYSLKKKKFKEYLNYPLVRESLKNAEIKSIDLKRKIVLLLIKLKIFFLINILGKMRKK